MGYIGNEPTTGHFPVQTNLVGPGPTYTLTQAPANAGAIEVSVAGVLQPTTAYSVSGITLTMAGVAVGIPIFIRHLGETLSIPVPGDGTVTDVKIATGAVTDAKIIGMAASKLTGTIAGARLPDPLPAISGASLTGIIPADASVTNAKTDFLPGTTFKGDGSSVSGKIIINCEMNTHGVSIQSPAHSSAAAYTLTLPPTAGSAGESLTTDGSGVLSFAAAGGGGKVVQSVETLNNTLTSMTGTINRRSTSIPQNTWGDEVMTRAILPTSATNLLYIWVFVHVGTSGSGAPRGTLMLFQDTTANAIASTSWYAGGGGDEMHHCPLFHKMVAGTTSSTTFKVRVGGGHTAPHYLNGSNQGDVGGGTQYSSIVVQEIDPS